MSTDDLKKLCDAATEGPWFTHTREASGEAEIWSVEHPKGYDDLIAGSFKSKAHAQGIDNAIFIAAARTALPELIAEVERLREAMLDAYVKRDGTAPETTFGILRKALAK